MGEGMGGVGCGHDPVLLTKVAFDVSMVVEELGLGGLTVEREREREGMGLHLLGLSVLTMG